MYSPQPMRMPRSFSSACSAITAAIEPTGVGLPPRLQAAIKVHHSGSACIPRSIMVLTTGIIVAATGMLSTMPAVTNTNGVIMAMTGAICPPATS